VNTEEERLEAEAERLYNDRFRAPFGTKPWSEVGDHVKIVYRDKAAAEHDQKEADDAAH
jgi:hypothetical protein